MAEPIPPLKRPPGYKDPNAPTLTPNNPSNHHPIHNPILPMYKPKPKRKTNCCRCCCCIFCTLFFLIIIFIATAGAIFYLWYEPKIPNYHLKSLKFSTFKVSVNPDGTFLDAQSDIRFEVTNPNTKIGILYDRTVVQLSIGEGGYIDIGSSTVPAFSQGKRNATMLKFSSGVKHLSIDDDDGAELKTQIQSKQMLVTVEVQTKVGLVLNGLKIGKLPVRVLCENLSLNKLHGGRSPKCTITILKWINIH